MKIDMGEYWVIFTSTYLNQKYGWFVAFDRAPSSKLANMGETGKPIAAVQGVVELKVRGIETYLQN